MNSLISALDKLTNTISRSRAFNFTVKRLPVLALGTILLAVSCDSSSNNDDDDETPAEISVVLNEVQYVGTDRVEILNTGTTVADLSDYWLCLGPGTYVRLGDTTPISGSVSALQPGGFLVLPYDLPDTDAGLGLYSTNEFANADAIVDFVQYGASGSARENVAVAAGIWTEGDFVPTVIRDGSIIFDGEGNGAEDWAETTTPTFGAANELTIPEPLRRSIVINEVEYIVNDYVELYNNGEVMVDLSSYWLCLGPGTYVQIGDVTPVSGSIDLAPGEFVVLPYTMPNSDAGLGLYSMNQFGNPDAIVDFVQYGAGGSAREDVAVQAGIWAAGEFVPVVDNPLHSLVLNAGAEGNSAADFSEALSSFGATNTFDLAGQAVSNVIINEVFYAGNQAVELYNGGTQAEDVSNYFLCVGPGTYRQISGLTVVNGTTTIAPGEFLTVTYDQLDATADGLGLYIDNSGFGNPATLIDFVQYGAAGDARESEAVAAGLWPEGEFVPTVGNPLHALVRNAGAAGDEAADFSEALPSLGAANTFTLAAQAVSNVVINEVLFLGGTAVEIRNNGTEMEDVSDYFLCLGPGTYRRIDALPLVSGNTTIAPGEFLVITYDQLNAVSGGLGLYIDNSGFGNPATLIDFVQYGAAGTSRESEAVTAGLWSAGDFVAIPGTGGNSIQFDGIGNASTDWAEGAPTLGAANTTVL